MKHIETNFLIYDLAKQGVKKKRTSMFKFIFSTICLSSIFIALYLLNVELRFNLDYLMNYTMVITMFDVQLAGLSIVSVLGCYLAYQLSVPAQDEKLSFKILNAIFYIIWLSLIVSIGIFAYQEYLVEPNLNIDIHCVERSLIGISLPILVLAYFVRKGYVLKTYQMLVLVCLTSFGFASFINLFVCPVLSMQHILLSHYVIIFPIILVIATAFKILKK
ncbi:MAG TPA: hypothetical protein DCL21_06975 [Alphaproteobacteria bacterium]|nr:hypothetical protein [Alphaproteobacteria bacterium]